MEPLTLTLEEQSLILEALDFVSVECEQSEKFEALHAKLLEHWSIG